MKTFRDLRFELHGSRQAEMTLKNGYKITVTKSPKGMPTFTVTMHTPKPKGRMGTYTTVSPRTVDEVNYLMWLLQTSPEKAMKF